MRRQLQSEFNRPNQRDADGDDSGKPCFNNGGQFGHADRDGDQCQRRGGERVGWLELHVVGEWRHAGSQSECHDDLHGHGDGYERERIGKGYGDGDGSASTAGANGDIVGKPDDDHGGKFVDIDGSGDQCDRGYGDGNGWQQLYVEG